LKKILFALGNLNIGGIQKSLLELLKHLSSSSEYEVCLFLSEVKGDYLDKVPKNIKILDANKWATLTEKSLKACKALGLKYFLFRFFASAWSKIFNKSFPSKLLCKKIGNLGEFDLAISYTQPICDKQFSVLSNEIVLNCVKAKRKATFCHCDFSKYGGNSKLNRSLYKKFDKIAVVSNSVGKKLVQCIPEVSSKVTTVYNLLDHDGILKFANVDPIVYTKKSIVTVARLSAEKGISRCVSVISRLKSEKLDFEWHIVGDGPERENIKNLIDNYSLNQVIKLHGQTDNPYRYMLNADYLFLPSFHEAAPIVFDEACALNIPILSTNTLSAKEMVEDREVGLVCENDVEAIYQMLKTALTSDVAFKKSQFDDKISLERFNKLLD